MYNIALKYIKNTIETDKSCLNFMKTRDKLKNERDTLKGNSTIKTHDINSDFSMPNLISVDRLKKFYENDNNYIIYIYILI